MRDDFVFIDSDGEEEHQHEEEEYMDEEFIVVEPKVIEVEEFDMLNPLVDNELTVTTNSLYTPCEECDDDKWMTMSNCLSSFYGLPDSDFEEEERWHTNALFDGEDRTFLLPNGWVDYDRLRLFNMMKAIPTDENECWSASVLIDLILVQAQRHFTREDARVFLYQMISQQFARYLRPILVPVPYQIDSYDIVPLDSMLYRAFDVDYKIYYEETMLNVKSRTKSVESESNVPSPMKSPRAKLDSLLGLAKRYTQRLELPLNLEPFNTSSSPLHSPRSPRDPEVNKLIELLRPKRTIEIVRQVENVLEKLLKKNAHIVHADNCPVKQGFIAYHTIALSDELQELMKVAEDLRLVDVTVLGPNEAKAFYCNIFNMMCFHALLCKGCYGDEQSRMKFAREPFYFVGKHKLSMQDIYHVILRGMTPPPYKYYLRDYQLGSWQSLNTGEKWFFDPRIHFVLHNGCMSSPMPYAVTLSEYDDILDTATRVFVNTHVQINEADKRIVLPDVFQRYRRDFCSSNKNLDLLGFICNYLTDSKYNTVIRMLQDIDPDEQPLGIAIEYAEYDWKPNRKPNTLVSTLQINYDDLPKIDLTMNFILSDAYFRPYFKTYCAFELSTENFAFIEAAQVFKSCVNDLERKKMGTEIVQKFFGGAANPPANSGLLSMQMSARSLQYDLNVSQKLAILTVSRYNSEIQTGVLKADLFDKIVLEATMNLSDTYCRFVNTDMYRSMVEDYIRTQVEKCFKTVSESVSDLMELQKEVPTEASSAATPLTSPRKPRVNFRERMLAFRPKMKPPLPKKDDTPEKVLTPLAASRASDSFLSRINQFVESSQKNSPPQNSPPIELSRDRSNSSTSYGSYGTPEVVSIEEIMSKHGFSRSSTPDGSPRSFRSNESPRSFRSNESPRALTRPRRVSEVILERMKFFETDS